MSTSKTAGFTLAEVLVVLAVVGLLAALAVPFFHKTYAIQRRVSCASNLEKLGQAYAARAVEAGPISVAGWQRALTGYVGKSIRLFICPDDPNVAEERHGGQLYIAIYRGSCSNPAHHHWDQPLDEALCQWTWRMSPGQFNELADAPGHGQTYSHPGYVPGPDPAQYFYAIEDQGLEGGGDRDYWDENLSVRETDVGLTVTPVRGEATYNFNLVMGEHPDQVEIIHDMKARDGETFLVPRGSQTSYGMNSVAYRTATGKRTLLLLDYESPVARGSDLASTLIDDWSETDTVAPRHFTKCNVLFGDGAVGFVRPDRMDPIWAGNRQKFWNP